MAQFMIDIETMAVSLHNSLVLSVAAVSFSLSSSGPTIGEGRVWFPSLRSQLAIGRTADPETVRWWAAQDAEARRSWELGEECSLGILIGAMTEFMGNGPEVWANGAAFDFGNLENLARDGARRQPPWRYNAVRDARTIYALPQRHEVPDNLKFVPHEPLDDCRLQVWRLWCHWPAGDP